MFSSLATSDRFTANRLIPVFQVAFFLFIALIGGVVAGTGNQQMVITVGGILIGGMLMGSASAVVWLILVGTLLISGPLVMFHPELRRVPWVLSMLGFLLIATTVMHIGANKHNLRNPPPPYVAFALALLLFVLLTSLFGDGGTSEKASALKRYFQFWGLFLVFAVVPFSPTTVKQWIKAFMLIALVQLPFALYQLIKLVPMRMNMPGRVVPIDIVTGTLEGDIWGGGNNNTMVYLLFVAAVGLVSAYRDNFGSRRKVLLMLAIILTPLVLGETKIALVMLPMAFIATFGDLIRSKPMQFMWASLGAGILLVGLLFVYVEVQSDGPAMSFQQKLDANLAYNFGEVGYNGGGSLNRATAVPFWWKENGLNDPVGTILGHGVGSSFASDSDDNAGHLDKKYPGYAIGLTGISILLWDIGILGCLLYLSVLAGAAWAAHKMVQKSTSPLDRAFLRALMASALIQLILMPFSDALLIAPSTEVLQALTLGLIAWRWRQTQQLG